MYLEIVRHRFPHFRICQSVVIGIVSLVFASLVQQNSRSEICCYPDCQERIGSDCSPVIDTVEDWHEDSRGHNENPVNYCDTRKEARIGPESSEHSYGMNMNEHITWVDDTDF